MYGFDIVNLSFTDLMLSGCKDASYSDLSPCSERMYFPDNLQAKWTPYHLVPRFIVILVPYMRWGVNMLWRCIKEYFRAGEWLILPLYWMVISPSPNGAGSYEYICSSPSTDHSNLFCNLLYFHIVPSYYCYYFPPQAKQPKPPAFQHTTSLVWSCLSSSSSLTNWKYIQRTVSSALDHLCFLRKSTILRLGVIMVFVIQMLLMMAGDVEPNPGPGEGCGWAYVCVGGGVVLWAIWNFWVYVSSTGKGEVEKIYKVTWTGFQVPSWCNIMILHKWMSHENMWCEPLFSYWWEKDLVQGKP